MPRVTNIMVLKGRVTKCEQRLVQIKNQMMEAAKGPSHVPYASFNRWSRQTKQIRQKIAWLKQKLKKKLNKPEVVHYDSNPKPN